MTLSDIFWMVWRLALTPVFMIWFALVWLYVIYIDGGLEITIRDYRQQPEER